MTDTPKPRRTFVTILSDIKIKLQDEQEEREATLKDLTRIDTRIRVLKEILDEAEKNGEAE